MIAARVTRRAITTMLAAFAALLVVTASAHAGSVTRAGTILIYTSGVGEQERLSIRQPNATTMTFDDANLILTSNAAGCLVFGGKVACDGATWSTVVVRLNDGAVDLVRGNLPNYVLTVPMDVTGGPGDDRVYAGNGNDTVNLQEGAGWAQGNAGNDTLRSGTEGVELAGQDGDDLIDARAMRPNPTDSGLLSGGDGADTLLAGNLRSFMDGGAGADLLTGGSADDVLNGGAGADSLSSGAGNDKLHGGSTEVGTLVTSDGPDQITGGDGNDFVSYDGRTTGVSVDLATAGGDGEAGENDGVSLDVEGIEGGEGPDALLGNAVSNEIYGGGGADTIDGRGGFDQLSGAADADTINASSDLVADFVDCGNRAVAPGTDADVANLDHLDLVDIRGDCETINRLAPPPLPTQTGTPQPDRLRGTAAADELVGGAGRDTLLGLAGNDRIRGGSGNDLLYGGLGADDIDGDSGNDVVEGNAGDDSLDGGAGGDMVRGGPGRDALVGGRGRDTLDGGLGPDFVSSRDGAGSDVVTCTRVNLRTRFGRLQRDVVVADRSDVIVNRRFCARVTFT